MDDSDDDVRSDFYNYDYDQEDESEERDSAGDLVPSVTIYEMQEPKQSFCLLDPNPGSCRGKVCTDSNLTSKIIPTIHSPDNPLVLQCYRGDVPHFHLHLLWRERQQL